MESTNMITWRLSEGINSLITKEVKKSNLLIQITFMKCETQIRVFKINCEECNLLVVTHRLSFHNQVREIFSKEINEVSGPGLDSQSPGKGSNRNKS